MSPETVEQIIKQALPDAKVKVSGADCNFTVEVTSQAFAGKSPLLRHRMINDLFKSQLASGELHALSIKTQLPDA